MIIRKYLVDNINEALFRIKHELGDDAYIISQKMVRQPGVKGFFSNKKIEVTVGLLNKENIPENQYLHSGEVQNNVLNNSSNQLHNNLNNMLLNGDLNQKSLSQYSQNTYAPEDKTKSMSYYNKLFEEKQKMFNNNFDNEVYKKDFQNFQQDINLKQDKVNDFNIKNLSAINRYKKESSIIDLNLEQDRVQVNGNRELKKELEEIKTLVKGIANGRNNNISPNYLDEFLYNHDICKELSDEIKSKCNLTDDELMCKPIVKKYLRDIFSNIIKVYDGDISDKFVVVGPTGSGKTTTVAKIAGILSHNFNKKVGLVTIDTFRVGAVEQLKMYADIMNIPYKSVMTLGDIKTVFDDMKDCDVVLVDTIGRGNKNIIQLNELSMFVQSIQSHDVSLVVSAGMKQQDVDLFIDSFKGIKFTNVIITKLDETNSFGMLVNICYKLSIPISFLTIGQDVPLDIRKANKKEILDIILGE